MAVLTAPKTVFFTVKEAIERLGGTLSAALNASNAELVSVTEFVPNTGDDLDRFDTMTGGRRGQNWDGFLIFSDDPALFKDMVPTTTNGLLNYFALNDCTLIEAVAPGKMRHAKSNFTMKSVGSIIR